MPKLLVLYHDRAGDTAPLANAIAEGARGVKFAEVDVRRIGASADVGAGGTGAATAASRHRALDASQTLAGYDGILLGASVSDGSVAELTALLSGAGAHAEPGALVDRVGAVFTPSSCTDPALWPVLARMAALGMILLPAGYTDPADPSPLSAARLLGRRVAKLVEWVRHAKGHEHGHHHH